MSNEYKSVLVAVDGSKASEKAFYKALSIVKRNKSKLIIAHVVDYRTFAYGESYVGTLAEQAEKYANSLIDSFIEKAKEAEIAETNISRCIEYGSAKVKIVDDITKKFNVDLIVCGATGMNAVERLLIGSVSENITRHATCDVLVVR